LSGRDVLGNLQDYDPAELLVMLAEAKRTGTFQVHHLQGPFRLTLSEGRVVAASFGSVRDAAAVARLLRHPVGQFVFLPSNESPRRGTSMSRALLAALRLVPPAPVDYDGQLRWRGDDTTDDLSLTDAEQRAVKEAEAGRSLADLRAEMDVYAAAARLLRVGLLVPRKVRVARLTVTVWRGGPEYAVVDASIMAAWARQVGEEPETVLVRTDAGHVATVPVRGAPDLGTQFMLAPEALVLYGLTVGEAVLVRPA